MNRARMHVAAGLLALTAAFAGWGCGLNMEGHYRNYRSDLLDRDFADADAYIDSKKKTFYGKKNRLLYYMDKGMVLHLDKRYDDSNVFLEKAKATAQELWTDSIGENAASWLTTDNSVSYQGEDFEKVLIHFVAALNRIEANDYPGARVEARQITSKLNLYNSKYEDEHKSAYRDDAFARWLAGKLSETEAGYTALNDAWIDYNKALTVYRTEYAKRYRTPVPTLLVADALRVLDGLGPDFAEEFQQVRGQYPAVSFRPHAEVEGLGQVVLLHLAGEAPYKRDRFWTAPANGKIIRIAFPSYVSKPHRVTKARITVAGVTAETELMEDITAIAIQNLEDHMGRIRTKAIARTVAKLVAQDVASGAGKALAKKGGRAGAAGAALQVGAVLWNVSSAVAEESDKRSWVTLPSAVSAAKLFTAPGPVSAKVEFLDRSGRVVHTTQLTGQVEAGGVLVLPYRTFL